MSASVSIGLMLIGDESALRWASRITSDNRGGSDCCKAGHHTPEAAAAHGGELAVALLARQARAAGAGSAGALAIAQNEPALPAPDGSCGVDSEGMSAACRPGG